MLDRAGGVGLGEKTDGRHSLGARNEESAFGGVENEFERVLPDLGPVRVVDLSDLAGESEVEVGDEVLRDADLGKGLGSLQGDGLLDVEGWDWVL